MSRFCHSEKPLQREAFSVCGNPVFANFVHLISMANKPGVLYYSTLGMTILYFLAGLYFIFADHAKELFPGTGHYGIGALFIGYGIFRIFRLKKIRESTYNNNGQNQV